MVFIGGAILGAAIGAIGSGIYEYNQTPQPKAEDALNFVVIVSVLGALAGAAIAELTAPPLGAYGIPGDIEQATFGYAESGPPHIY